MWYMLSLSKSMQFEHYIMYTNCLVHCVLFFSVSYNWLCLPNSLHFGHRSLSACSFIFQPRWQIREASMNIKTMDGEGRGTRELVTYYALLILPRALEKEIEHSFLKSRTSYYIIIYLMNNTSIRFFIQNIMLFFIYKFNASPLLFHFFSVRV